MHADCNSDTDQSKQSLSPKYSSQHVESLEVYFGEEVTSPRGQRIVKSQRKARPSSAPRSMSDISWRGCCSANYCLPDVRRTSAMYIEQDIIHKQRQEIQLLMEELGNRDQELNDLVMSHQKQVKAWECNNEKQKALQSRLNVIEDEMKVKEEQLKKTLVEMAHVKEQREVDALELKKTHNEMIKLTERIMENSIYIKEMEIQNQKLSTSVRELMSAKHAFSVREQELLKLLKEKDFQLAEKRQEVDKLVETMTYLECQCRQLGEHNNNMTEESVNWKKKYYLMKEEAERLNGSCRKKEENIQKMTQQLHESLQQAIALQKALFTSCEREKCKEEVMYSLRKQHKRTMQELQNIRELYDRLSQDTNVHHLNGKDKESDGKKREEEVIDEEGRSKKNGKEAEEVDKSQHEFRRKLNTAVRYSKVPGGGFGSKNSEIRESRDESSSQMVAGSGKSVQSHTNYPCAVNTSDGYFKSAREKQLKSEDRVGDVSSGDCGAMLQNRFEESQCGRMSRDLMKETSQVDSNHADRANVFHEGNSTNSDSNSPWNALNNVDLIRRKFFWEQGKEENQTSGNDNELLQPPKHFVKNQTEETDSQETPMKSCSMEAQSQYVGAEIGFHLSPSRRNHCTSARVNFHPQSNCLQARPRFEGHSESLNPEGEEGRTRSSYGESQAREQCQHIYNGLRQEFENVEKDCQNSNIGEDNTNLHIQNQHERDHHLRSEPCDQCRTAGKHCCDCSRIQKSSVPNSNETASVFDPALPKSNKCCQFQKDLSAKSSKVLFEETSFDNDSLEGSKFRDAGRIWQVVGSQQTYSQSMLEFSRAGSHHSSKKSHFSVPLDSFLTPVCTLSQTKKTDLPDEVSACLARQRPVRREMYCNNNNRSNSPLDSDISSMVASSQKRHENVIERNTGQSQCKTHKDISCNNNGVCSRISVQPCLPIAEDSRLTHDSTGMKEVHHKQEKLQDEQRGKSFDEDRKRLNATGNNNLSGSELSDVKKTDNGTLNMKSQLCEPVKEVSFLKNTVSERRLQLVRSQHLEGQISHKLQSFEKDTSEDSYFYPEETDSESEISSSSKSRLLSAEGKEGSGATFHASIPTSTRSPQFSIARTSSLQKRPEKMLPVQADSVSIRRDNIRSGITVSSNQKRSGLMVSSSQERSNLTMSSNQDRSSLTVPSPQKRSNNSMLSNQERPICRVSDSKDIGWNRCHDIRSTNCNNTSGIFQNKSDIKSSGKHRTNQKSTDYSIHNGSSINNLNQTSCNSSSNVTFGMAGNCCHNSSKIKEVQTVTESDMSCQPCKDLCNVNNNNSDVRHDSNTCSNIKIWTTSADSCVSPKNFVFAGNWLVVNDTASEESRTRNWSFETSQVDWFCFLGTGFDISETDAEANTSRETMRLQNSVTCGIKIWEKVNKCLFKKESRDVREQTSATWSIQRRFNILNGSFMLDVVLKGDTAIEKINEPIQTKILHEYLKNSFHVYSEFEEKLVEILEERNAGYMRRSEGSSEKARLLDKDPAVCLQYMRDVPSECFLGMYNVSICYDVYLGYLSCCLQSGYKKHATLHYDGRNGSSLLEVEDFILSLAAEANRIVQRHHSYSLLSTPLHGMLFLRHNKCTRTNSASLTSNTEELQRLPVCIFGNCMSEKADQFDGILFTCHTAHMFGQKRYMNTRPDLGRSVLYLNFAIYNNNTCQWKYVTSISDLRLISSVIHTLKVISITRFESHPASNSNRSNSNRSNSNRSNSNRSNSNRNERSNIPFLLWNISEKSESPFMMEKKLSSS